MIQRLFRTAIFAALIPAGVAAADFGGAMILYQQGQYAAAQQEFLALANEGDPDAQFILGDMYARGQGVTPDQIKQGEALAAGPPAAATPPPPPPAAGTPAPRPRRHQPRHLPRRRQRVIISSRGCRAAPPACS